jgi:hypothetical protein
MIFIHTVDEPTKKKTYIYIWEIVYVVSCTVDLVRLSGVVMME